MEAPDGAGSEPAVPAARAAELLSALMAPAAGGGGGAGHAPAPGDSDGEEADDPAHRVVLPADVTTLSADMEELVHVGTQGRKVTILDGIGHLTRLRVLCLRSNLLRTMAGVSAVAPTLEELELYDNLLRELEELRGAGALRVLDVSYNKLRSLDGLAGNCPRLEVLYAASNKLSAVAPPTFAACAAGLRVLDLGANGLRSMAGWVEGLTGLEELWLGKNKLTRIEGLAGLRRLRILDVQSNRLTAVTGLGGEDEAEGGGAAEGAGTAAGSGGPAGGPQLPELQELYLGHNGLTRIGGALAALPSLATLDLSGNQLTRVDGLSGERHPALTDVWLGYNRIAAFADAVDGLRGLPALEVVYLEHNPLAADWEYRMRLARELPTLRQLDATPVRRT